MRSIKEGLIIEHGDRPSGKNSSDIKPRHWQIIKSICDCYHPVVNVKCKQTNLSARLVDFPLCFPLEDSISLGSWVVLA